MVKVRFGKYVLDSGIPELTKDGSPVAVEPKVFDFLVYLVRHRDRTISKDELIDEVWGGRIVSDAAVTSRLNLVRRAVGDNGRDQKIIQTIPKRGFRFIGVTEEVETSELIEGNPAERIKTADCNQASVLVLPFNDLSNDASQFLAQGLTEDLIVALSRHSDVSVISFNTAQRLGENSSLLETPLARIPADFLVSGTVRVAADAVRITVQLSERDTGVTVYSEKFDRNLDDIFVLQDEVVRALAGCLPSRVVDAIGRRITAEQPPDLTSYKRLIKITNELDGTNDVLKFLAELKDLLSSDPNYAFAHAQLAFYSAYKVFVTGQQTEDGQKTAITHANMALRLAPINERILSKAAMVFQFAGQYSLSQQLSRQAIKLNPNSTLCTHYHANILGASGAPEEAIVVHNQTLSLDPLFPEYYYEGVIETLFLLGKYEEALEIVDKWRNPRRHVWAHVSALAALAGDKYRAKESVERFEDTHPQRFSNAVFVAAHLRYHRRVEDRKKWLEGFRTSGLSGLEDISPDILT